MKEAARVAFVARGVIIGNGAYKPGEPGGKYKGAVVGEGAIMPTIPAILNAIYDAVGVRINELPVISERLFAAMKEKQKK